QASDLLPSTRYRYALIATNQYGTQTIGQYQTLKTTAATPPGAATGLATAIGQTSATLNGTVTTNGLATSYSFQVGTEPGVYGSPTGLGGVGGNTTQEVSTALTGLAPGTTYYYRLRATNSDGTTYGQPEPFTTAGLSYLLTVPAAALTAPIQAGQQNIEEHPAVNSGPSHLTNRQKLSKALTACRKGRKKTKRVKCERQARARYHVKKK
ncbi:MAG: fibronectin type III domain-containing protein, partial [Solirubrobacteraceae bacterium]